MEPVGPVSPPTTGVGSSVDQVEDEASLPGQLQEAGHDLGLSQPVVSWGPVRRGRADQHRRGDPRLSGVPRIGQLAPLATQPPVFQEQPLSLHLSARPTVGAVLLKA